MKAHYVLSMLSVALVVKDPIAQWLACLTSVPKVLGSSPALGTIFFQAMISEISYFNILCPKTFKHIILNISYLLIKSLKANKTKCIYSDKTTNSFAPP